MPPYAEFAVGTAARRRLEALDDSAIARLEEISRVLDLPQGRPIIIEGDPAMSLYSLQIGVASVFKLLPDGRRQITGFLYPGDFLGITFNLNAEYGYSAETVTSCSLRLWPRAALERLFEEAPGVRRMFLAEMADELTAAQDRMLTLARRTAEERVAMFLITMVRRQADGAEAPCETLHVPMRWADIADYLGLTAETVSRTLSSFRDRGIVRTGMRSEIGLRNRQALEDIAAGTYARNGEIYS
jgi:CRP/FNR family transcriptional regulator